MSSCINKTTQEYKELLEKSGLDPIILNAKIGVYQDNNGIDKFPSIGDLNIPVIDNTMNPLNNTESLIEKFYSSQEDNNTLSQNLINSFTNRSEDSLDLTERKIEILKSSLNAEVIVDASIPDSGQLLPANHPLSKKYRKPVILINPNKLFSDTVIHEFGHLYIDLLGNEDSLLNQAYELLRGTKFYNDIALQYPELNSTDLDKEVLATAIGIEGDRIFPRDIEQLSIWQKIKNYIIDKLSKLFNIQPNAIEQLATELLSGKTRLSGAESYNTIITQRSKFKIDESIDDTNKQSAVINLLKSLNTEFDKQTIDNENVYIDKEGNIHNNSVTKNIKKYQKRYNNTDKGDYEIKFDRSLFTKENIEFQLNQPKLPLALTKALNDFINDRIISTSFTKNAEDKTWFESYTRELSGVKEEDLDELAELTAGLINQTNGGDSAISFTANLLKHLDLILNRADEYQLGYNQAPIVGNIIHTALENYVNNNESFPENINDNENLLLNTVKSIIDNGKANGSIFLTEQTLYSENRQIPGTADLIEITKDGEARIYDYKTINSFIGNNKGDKYNKSDEALYYNKGYMHQLLSYGAILNQYNISLADDPYHIIMAEVSYSNVEDENSPITINEVRNKSLSDSNTLSLLNSVRNTIFNEFATSKELENINIKPDIQTLNDLVNRINDYITIYKKRTKNIASNLDTTAIDKISDVLSQNKDLEQSINTYIAKNNQLIINTYIDNIHNALALLESQKEYLGETPSPEFLQSLNYVLQSTKGLDDIKKLLDNSPEIELDDKEKLLRILNKTINTVKTNKDYYKAKLQRLSIAHFAQNSNLMYGLYKEKFQKEANDLKYKGEAKDAHIQKKLREKDNEIKVKELNYWTKQYEDGFTDLRYLEYLMADPGISKSQHVQVVKNIMDKADQAKRNKMLDIIPDINKWFKNMSFDKIGDPKKIYNKILEKNKDKLTGAVIPEFTSKYREEFLKYEYQLKDKYKALKKENNIDKISELKEQIEVLKKERQKSLKEKTRDIDDFQESYTHPEFVKLNEKEQSDLRFIHKNLLSADERLDAIKEKKLVKELTDGTYIFNLPKERMSFIESFKGDNKILKNYQSKFMDIIRPPADEDELNISQQEYGEDKTNSSELDIYGNEIFSVPVYYRNELEDEELQSYDIPSLLALNHETTVSYQENKLIEADLFVIAESLNSNNNNKILKTDSFVNQKIKNVVGNNFQKSDQNLVYQAVKSSIDNRLYKRAYKGVYSKGNYQIIKGAEAISKYASTLVLAGNFMSGLSTFTQGGIYRFLEGSVGEHITLDSWKLGTQKAWKDFPNMLADTQKFVPTSKSELFIKKFGLETHAHALTNKFVQDNFANKQLDSGTLFSVTSMAEAVVTSNLMYSLLSNIKVTNDKGEYIDQNGKKVSKNEAMSLDEAYTVVEGKLVLNPKVKYTSFNITEKYNDGVNKDNTIAATEISRYIRSVYADLYGQYNSDMKSVLQRTIWGKLAMSLRGWLPRGVNRRWRGITDVVGKDFMTFDELRDESNIDKRFYSQDQKQFQEGHYTTSIRFLRNIYKEFKQNNLTLSNSRSQVRSTMTDHEIANLKRTQYELAVIIGTMALAMLLRTIAMNSGGDDKDKEKIYFAAYLSSRINNELATFINPGSMMQMLSNPAASMSVVQRVFDWSGQLVGISYDKDEGWDFNANDVYSTGTKKDENKLLIKSLGLIPGNVKFNQLKSILGFDSNNTLEDSFTYTLKN